MSIGKNSILRVQNAEKNGAAPIVNEAPDMENSTVIEETPKKKAAPKKTASSAKSTKAAPKKSAPKKNAPKKAEEKNMLTYCQIGDEMPVYLL